MIRISVDGRPEVEPFVLEPPQPAETVIEAVATALEVDTGILKAGQQLFAGKTAVHAGDYVFKTRAARAEGRPYTLLGSVSIWLEQLSMLRPSCVRTIATLFLRIFLFSCVRLDALSLCSFW